MGRNELSGPQRRSISATLKMIEKSLNELGDLTGLQRSYYTTHFNDPLNDLESQRVNNLISDIRGKINMMLEKYKLDKDEISMDQVLNSKKAYLWTILEDSTSKRMKGYGDFPESVKERYDEEIQEIMELVSKL
jgi:hypothetical protein